MAEDLSCPLRYSVKDGGCLLRRLFPERSNGWRYDLFDPRTTRALNAGTSAPSQKGMFLTVSTEGMCSAVI